MLFRLRSKSIGSYLAFAIFLTSSTSAFAQFFSEQFDGSSSINWLPLVPFDAGERTIVDGAYVITPGTVPNNSALPGFAESDSYAEDRVFGTVSVQSRLRVEDAPRQDYWVGVFAKSRFASETEGNSAVFTAISETGTVALSTFDDRLNLDMTETVQTSLRPHLNDVLVQLDIGADTAELWAWEDGDSKPNRPLLVFNDLPNYVAETGEVGVFAANHMNLPTSFSFRYFETRAVPEPSGFGLIMPATIGILFLRKKRSRLLTTDEKGAA